MYPGVIRIALSTFKYASLNHETIFSRGKQPFLGKDMLEVHSVGAATNNFFQAPWRQIKPTLPFVLVAVAPNGINIITPQPRSLLCEIHELLPVVVKILGELCPQRRN